MAHFFKQASGEEPIGPDTDWYDAPARQFCADVLSFNQEYQKALDIAHRPYLKQLYRPESYAWRKGMENMVQELNAILEVDQKYESIDPIVARFAAAIRGAGTSGRGTEDSSRECM